MGAVFRGCFDGPLATHIVPRAKTARPGRSGALYSISAMPMRGYDRLIYDRSIVVRFLSLLHTPAQRPCPLDVSLDRPAFCGFGRVPMTRRLNRSRAGLTLALAAALSLAGC